MTLLEKRLQAVFYVLMRDMVPAGDLDEAVTACINQVHEEATENSYAIPLLARLAGQMVADLGESYTRLPAPGREEMEVL